MITICHPVDDMELLFIQMELDAASIPYFVVGQHFGSLYPGMQVPWHNERSIRVPIGLAEEARSVVNRMRSFYEPAFVNLTTHSKLRMLCEAMLFAWLMPSGSKKPSIPTFKQGAPNRRAT